MTRQDALRIAIRKFGPFESAIEKQWASFKDASGCLLTLEWEALDLNPLYESLFVAQGLKDGTWDIAFMVTDWLAEAVEEHALVDLSPYMQRAPLPDYPHGWSPTLLQFQQWDAAVYGVPYHDGPECLIYRRDLFENVREQEDFARRFGYPLAVPQSWPQFYDVARFFTRPSNGQYGTVFASYPDGHNTVYDFCLQLWSRGGALTDEQGTITLNSEEAVAALDFYRQLALDSSASYPDSQAIDSVRSGTLFREGNIAMMVNWFGFAAFCELPDSPVKGNIAIAPLPAGEGGSSASLAVYWLLSIASGSPHKDEAYAFLQHVCSAEMDKVTTLEGAIGCRLSTWNDAEVQAAVPYYNRLADLVRTARTLPRSKEFPKLAHLIDAVIAQALTSQVPTRDLLRDAQREAEQIKL